MTYATKTKFAAPAIAIAIAMSLAAQAQAGNVRFAFHPSELATSESVAALEERIAKVARAACGKDRGATPSIKRECRAALEATLRARVWPEAQAVAEKARDANEA